MDRATPVYACVVEGCDGLRVREALRRVSSSSGLYPLLTAFDVCGWDIPWFNEETGQYIQETHPVNPDSLEHFWQSFQSDLPERLPWVAVNATNAAMNIDSTKVFQALETLHLKQWEREYEALFLPSSTESVAPFAWQLSLNAEPYAAIVLLPVCEPWQAALFACHLSGNREHGWAEIGYPEFSPKALHSYELAQIAFDLVVCKHWWETCRAEIVYSEPNSLHWIAAYPPRTFEAALQLAKEQYLYCNDAVAQRARSCEDGRTLMAESICHLAQILQVSNRWSLGWD
ncbi:MAG: DUF4253 domain-containing protein [Cyanobacteria bacterium J06639_1]